MENKISSIVLSKKSELLTGVDPVTSLVVTDTNCQSLFDHSGYHLLVLEPGEPSKNFHSLQAILEKAVALGLDRKALFVGIGGGVICDMTAFAASIYLRGCRVRLAPTTLLSMVDASVGGKTGIDFCGYKNQVGTFYPAEKVMIVPQFLSTLSDSEYLSGLGEVIKTAYLKEPQLLDLLEKESASILNRELPLMQDIIIRCILTKGYFVENDFREGGIRAFLNLGHTFGHALESVEELGGVTHGEAVVWGMLKAAETSIRIFNLDDRYLDRLKGLALMYGYKLSYPTSDVDKMIQAMNHDKKKSGTQLNFILQRKEFETETVVIKADSLKEILEDL